MTLESETNRRNRSMELSEILVHSGKPFAMCDYTGIVRHTLHFAYVQVYRIQPDTGDVFQRYAIADGDGKRSKPFKIEWATVCSQSVLTERIKTAKCTSVALVKSGYPMARSHNTMLNGLK